MAVAMAAKNHIEGIPPPPPPLGAPLELEPELELELELLELELLDEDPPVALETKVTTEFGPMAYANDPFVMSTGVCCSKDCVAEVTIGVTVIALMF